MPDSALLPAHRAGRRARLPLEAAALLVAGALTALALTATPAHAQRDTTPVRAPAHDPFRFEMMGPAAGGRIASVVGVPGDSRTWYIGNASGGVWKSSDSGSTFVPVFDKEPVQAIGALAVAPSNHAMVWAGTGEAWAIRDADIAGDGVYLSTDSGATWRNMGLRETGRIGRIIVHPTNPNIVYVCALGRVTGPQQERGVYRTTDGGKTWQRVLFVDPNTGCSGLTLDAHDPGVLFAGMWQVEMHTYAMYGGGPSSGVYVSRNGGTTWTHLTGHGLPNSPLGKIDVAVAPSTSRRVYALIQTADQGSVWRSDDGGASWRAVNWARTLIGRAGYYIRIAVSPANPDRVLIANSSFFQSLDGGKTFRDVPWGGDNHDIWFDPMQPDRIGLTDDAGARFTINSGKTWKNVELPNAQAYHVAVDNRTPYWIYTNRQDNGTMRGPSTAPEAGPEGRNGPPMPARAPRGTGGDSTAHDSTMDSTHAARRQPLSPEDSADRADSIARDSMRARYRQRGSAWERPLGGCESGFTIPDPTTADIVWASCYGDEVTRWDAKTKLARSVSPWFHTLDSPPNELKYRCHWTPPLAIDPFDHNTVYYGCQVVFSTSDAGQHWKVISPDLSTRDPSRVVPSGGLVQDNLGQFYGEVVFAIAPSEIQRGLIWAGTNDGQLWYTRDHGGSWTNVTRNMHGLPAWGTIRKIEPSHFDAATAYVAIDLHMMDDRQPYVYKTTDFGRTWTNVTGDLPRGHPLDYVMAVAENPNRKGMLFTGTGHGFFYSLDDGAHWTRFSEGLPAAPVDWIVVPKRWHDVVVSTYGRGIYILKDIAPLEEQRGVPSAGALVLYRPHPGYRQARSGHADITFALASATKRPVTIAIVDSTGRTIRTMRVATRAGYNRASWDLRHDAPERVDLRTTPADNPHIWEEPRFRHKHVRPIVHWGIEQPESTGPIATPGHYTVRVSGDGIAPQSQPLVILQDEEILAAPVDLAASTRMQIRIRDDMDSAAKMINALETMRKQIEDARAGATGARTDNGASTPRGTTVPTATVPEASVAAALDALDRKMLDVELRLVSNADLQSDDKYYVERYRVYMNLVWLSGEVGGGAGDVAGGADRRPTDASRAVLDTIEQDLAGARTAYVALLRHDVPAFNTAMAGKTAAIVIP